MHIYSKSILKLFTTFVIKFLEIFIKVFKNKLFLQVSRKVS